MCNVAFETAQSPQTPGQKRSRHRVFPRNIENKAVRARSRKTVHAEVPAHARHHAKMAASQLRGGLSDDERQHATRGGGVLA